MVITTTNGTRALLACAGGRPRRPGLVRELRGDLAAAAPRGQADSPGLRGTEGQISYEDTLLAGAFAKHFRDLNFPMGNDEAEIAAGLWARVEDSIWFKSGKKAPAEENNPLYHYLTRGQGGRRVVELGLRDDIADAARLNRPDHQIVAELRRDPLRIVASS